MRATNSSTTNLLLKVVAAALMSIAATGCSRSGPTIFTTATPSFGLTKAYVARKPVRNKRQLFGDWQIEPNDEQPWRTISFHESGKLEVHHVNGTIQEWAFVWVSASEIVLLRDPTLRSELPESAGFEGDDLAPELLDNRFIVIEQEEEDAIVLSWIGNRVWFTTALLPQDHPEMTYKLTRNSDASQ